MKFHLKKKLSIVALAASLLGCKSAMAMASFASPSISVGQQYLNGKKKSGRDGSKMKSIEREKFCPSLLDDLTVWGLGGYMLANEFAGNFGLSDHELFGKYTFAKDAKPAIQSAVKSVRDSVRDLCNSWENKRKIAKYIKNKKKSDDNNGIKRAEYYYQNMEEVLLRFGIDNETSNKLIQIMDMQENSDFDFLCKFRIEYYVCDNTEEITKKINESVFKDFFDKLHGKKKLSIFESESEDFFDFDEGFGYFYALSSENLDGVYYLNIQAHVPTKFHGLTYHVDAKFFWKN